MTRIVALAVLVSFLCSGCYMMYSVAPSGSKVQLISETESTTVTASERLWFLLEGLIPLGSYSSDELIASYNLKEARVRTEHTFIDCLITAVTCGILAPVTMTVEGNR